MLGDYGSVFTETKVTVVTGGLNLPPVRCTLLLEMPYTILNSPLLSSETKSMIVICVTPTLRYEREGLPVRIALVVPPLFAPSMLWSVL